MYIRLKSDVRHLSIVQSMSQGWKKRIKWWKAKKKKENEKRKNTNDDNTISIKTWFSHSLKIIIECIEIDGNNEI